MNSNDSKDTGRKFDQNKSRWWLLPLDLVDKVVKVLTVGALKYDDFNWQKVENGKIRYYDAALRHIVDWRRGEIYDREDGIEHLAHAICNLLFCMWFDDQIINKLEKLRKLPTMEIVAEKKAKTKHLVKR